MLKSANVSTHTTLRQILIATRVQEQLFTAFTVERKLNTIQVIGIRLAIKIHQPEVY